MAIKLKWRPGARADLLQELAGTLDKTGEAVAKACNDESSWGYYASVSATYEGKHGTAPVTRVLSYNAESDARGNRLLRNLAAGGIA